MPKKWQGPLARLEQLCPSLTRQLSREFAGGNELMDAYLTTWGSRLPGEKACAVVRMRDAVQRRARYETGLAYFEEWDPHYTVGAVVLDEKTGCRLEGPPWLLTELRPALFELATDLAHGRYEAVARKSRGLFGAEALKAAVGKFGEAVVPPLEIFDDRSRGKAGALLINPARAGSFRIYFNLWFAKPRESSGAPSGLAAILDATIRGARVTWRLCDVTNGLDAFTPGERADAVTVSAVILHGRLRKRTGSTRARRGV